MASNCVEAPTSVFEVHGPQEFPTLTKIADKGQNLPPAVPSVVTKEMVKRKRYRAKKRARKSKTVTTAASKKANNAVVMLLRGVIVGINQANFTNNYSVIWGMASPQLKSRMSPLDLSSAFSELRRKKIDLSPVINTSPKFANGTNTQSREQLRLRGFFPTRPLNVQFDLTFKAVNGFWLIDAISIAAVDPIP